MVMMDERGSFSSTSFSFGPSANVAGWWSYNGTHSELSSCNKTDSFPFQLFCSQERMDGSTAILSPCAECCMNTCLPIVGGHIVGFAIALS
jgi:hypothetical protein